LERTDSATAKLCVQFLKLCDLNWSSEVSSVALRNLSDWKRCGVLVIPLTQDIMTLNKYLVTEASRVATDAEHDSSAFMLLTQISLAKVMLFNRK